MAVIDQLNNDGYGVYRQLVNQYDLYECANQKYLYDYPAHGYDTTGMFHNALSPHTKKTRPTTPFWAQYWTGPVNNFSRIKSIREVTDEIARINMDNPIFYLANVCVITATNSILKPTLGIPHRYPDWNKQIANRLGMHIGIPMNAQPGNESPFGFAPKSHYSEWNLDQCENDKELAKFLMAAEQPTVEFGDLIMWDSRTLYAALPLSRTVASYVLMLTYIESHIIADLMNYESTLSIF